MGKKQIIKITQKRFKIFFNNKDQKINNSISEYF